MSQISICVVEGRLSSDPVLSKTRAGKSICTFQLVNNRYYWQGKGCIDEVGYFRITAWGPLGERCSTALRKGNLVLISGNLRKDSFQTKAGEVKTEMVITAANVKFLSVKKSTDTQNGGK